MQLAFNLYPFNVWCLYGALGLLLISLIHLGIKAKPLAMLVKEIKPMSNHLKSNLESSKEKAAYIQSVAKANKDNSKSMFKSYLLFKAISASLHDKEKNGLNKDLVHAFMQQDSLLSFIKALF